MHFLVHISGKDCFSFSALAEVESPSFPDDINTPGTGQCNSFSLPSRVLGVAGAVCGDLVVWLGLSPGSCGMTLLWVTLAAGSTFCRTQMQSLVSSIVDTDPLVALTVSVRSSCVKKVQCGLYSNAFWSANRPQGCASPTPSLKKFCQKMLHSRKLICK